MSIAATAFEAIYATLTDLRCRVRVGGRTVITRAVTSGISFTRDDMDEGQADAPAGNTRFLAEDEPTPKIKVGDVIEIMFTANGETKYSKYRVMTRMALAGVVRLEIEGAH